VAGGKHKGQASPGRPRVAAHPIVSVQPLGNNQRAVVFVHPRESIGYQYERNPADPRVARRMGRDEHGWSNPSNMGVQGDCLRSIGRRSSF